MARGFLSHTISFASKMRTIITAFLIFTLYQVIAATGHFSQPQPQPQVIPVYVPQPQYPPQYPPQYQQQVIPVPQYMPQYIPVPQYVPQPQMMHHHHHSPHFDCYRGLALDRLIEDMERIETN